MFLTRLELSDYRNYQTFDQVFERNRILLLGENAQGKTNLLEAIATLATASSPFTSRDAELVRWGQPHAIVRSQLRKGTGSVGVDLLFRPAGRRAVKVNGVHQRRVADLLGTVSAVVFSRTDLDLVSGAPALRREFLDRLLMQVLPVFHEDSQRFGRIVTQRNHVLKAIAEGREDPRALDVWDEPLVRIGAKLHRRRQEAVDHLMPAAAAWHNRIAGGREELGIRYDPGLRGAPSDGGEWEDALARALLAARRKELGRAQTLVGPHRDDLAILLDGREARAFSSAGQKRTAAVALKLAELQVLRERTGEDPLLLLDDVLAELDVARQNRLLEAIGDRTQTFVTSTHLSDFSADWIARAEIFEVCAGQVRPYEP